MEEARARQAFLELEFTTRLESGSFRKSLMRIRMQGVVGLREKNHQLPNQNMIFVPQSKKKLNFSFYSCYRARMPRRQVTDKVDNCFPVFVDPLSPTVFLTSNLGFPQLMT